MYLFKLLLFNISLGFMCAVVAVVYRHILAHMPVLNWWFVIGFRFRYGSGCEKCPAWRENLHKLIWDCEQCQAGQLALWSAVYFSVTVDFYFSFIFGVAWAILCARLLKDHLLTKH